MRALFNHPLYRCFAYFLTFAVGDAMAPAVLPAVLGAQTKLPTLLALPKKMRPSRLLSDKQMEGVLGKDGTNPYFAGTQKWDMSYKGVDMSTGNYTMSATDLDFQGGYGIPVSVQRTYSANNIDEGPFGPGWSLSADVRTTAGGLLKSSHAPVMQVPTSYKELNPNQHDPRMSSPPAAGVTASDTSANPETIQKDVDGILTTPAWDANLSNPTYGYVQWNGATYQVETANTTNTPEGTVYTYATEGSYPNGMYPAGNPTGATVPSNVLKVTQVTDRQGNVTTYNYSSTMATFSKANGQTSENELHSVAMPNGHTLTFTWTTSAPYRIQSVTDGTRTVTYGYTGGLLTSVTSPGGKVTQFGYGGATSAPGLDSASNLLTTITDPRGLTTAIRYIVDTKYLLPYDIQLPGVMVSSIKGPNGNGTGFFYTGAYYWPYKTAPTTAVCDGAYEFVGDPASQSDLTNCYQVVLFSTLPNSSGYTMSQRLQTPRLPGEAWDYELGNSNQPYGITVVTNPFHPIGGLETDKSYDPFMQTCLTTSTYNPRITASAGYWAGDQMASFNDWAVSVVTDTYNFLGNPLEEDTEQYQIDGVNYNKITGYGDILNKVYTAYWGQSKFWQKKAVLDRYGYSGLPANTARVSYTDYIAAVQGSTPNGVGQVYETFQTPFAGFTTYNPVSGWGDSIQPSSGAVYSSQAVYDSKGRCTDVYKLQTTSPSAAYVRTNTVYNDTSGWWGEPSLVTEDYGGIARKTQTLAYDSSGHATETEDAALHKFQTTYQDNDYQVKEIDEVDGTTLPIVTYTYNETAPSQQHPVTDNGQVTSVTDNLTGVTDSFTYDDTPASGDGGLGQPSQVSESLQSWTSTTTYPKGALAAYGGKTYVSLIGSNLNNEPDTSSADWAVSAAAGYAVAYGYNAAGDRSTASYSTGYTSSMVWNYDNYCTVGAKMSRAPQTLRQLSSGSPTAEEFHYLYDTGGRMQSATFAMTPASGFTPTGSNPWYDSTHLASTRARVLYDNGPTSENLNLYYYWDTWNSGSYTSGTITGFQYGYDTTTLLKTGATFLVSNGSGGWNTGHNEAYGYDPNLDYLTSVNYGDGYSNATDTWSYDAAGNRASDADNTGTWSYDNLNRMTASPFGSYTNDSLGNRLTLGSSTSYGWDQLNRMTSFTSGSNTTTYAYRSDGLRVNKANPNGSPASTSYAYDGQMGIEDVDSTATPTITDYAIGARGVDWAAKRVGSGTPTIAYPLYDGHGNMVATLSKNGTTYALNDQRAYDAWGGIRNSDTSGDPKGRYCANLGHKSDDESGFVYMQARYYEPATGRFLSEDPAAKGWNLYVYCSNDPVGLSDPNGRDDVAAEMLLWGVFCMILGATLLGVGWSLDAKAFRMYDYAFNLRNQAQWLKDNARQLGLNPAENLADMELKALMNEGGADVLRGTASGCRLTGGNIAGVGVAVTGLAGYMLLVEAYELDAGLAQMGVDTGPVDFISFG